MNNKFSKLAIALGVAYSALAASHISYAAESAAENTADANATQQASTSNAEKSIEVISIFGQRNQLATATGSAFVLNEEALNQYEFDDIHRVLQSVPGVYIREEDGYGLRPNIGLRGATTERSSKVAIMEDGVLIAPAPYAAPAAYYFPNVSRMEQVEVFKGPAAIKYGPNTIGGAINMVSRQITDDTDKPLREIDIAGGQDGYLKGHGVYSQRFENSEYGDYGFLIEGIHLESDGFKELPNGDDTGFVKRELMFKADFSPANSKYYQLWQFKAGYSDEESDETYLGLTDADFAINPHQRYLASQDDKMDWEHYQFQVSHYIDITDSLSVFTQAYRRDFDRDWDRFNSFNTNRSMQTILTSPDTGLNALFMQVLTGERDSLTTEEQLLFTLNDRKFYSQGIESKLFWDTRWLAADVAIDAGLRIHQDQVERNHRQNNLLMQNGQLVNSGIAQSTITDNEDTATAVASYVNADVDFGQLNLTAGIRIEYIDGEAKDFLAGTTESDTDTVVLPGLGAFYQVNDELGFLFGVNKGFVPNSPGQDTDIDPEESWNYELGMRFSNELFNAELIGFYNDYENLKGTCTFSSGCRDDLDVEFNGGEVEVVGLESSIQAEFAISQSLTMPINIAYTYTDAEFQNDFQSTFSQWGNVTKGDKLPYLPENQLSVEVAIAHENWRAALLFKHADESPEAAGTGTELEGLMTDEIQQWDFSAWYQVTDALRTYVKVDNLTDEEVIVSRRPFGARPGKPQQASIGIKYSF
ncbi:TonB-dependent receptor family protein [Thalassotalea montiporae]